MRRKLLGQRIFGFRAQHVGQIDQAAGELRQSEIGRGRERRDQEHGKEGSHACHWYFGGSVVDY